MARKAILAVAIVGIAAVAAWRAGLLGPVGSTADGPLLESEIPGLAATAEGYGVAFELSVRAGSDVTLVLDRAASISGHVTDAEGTGIVGAKISVHVLYDALTMDRAGTSGAGGAYRVEGLPPTAR